MTNIPSFQHILLTQIPIPVQLLTSYKQLGLDETEAMVLLQIHRFLFEQNEFPTPMDIASCLTIGETECSNILRKLIQKDMLEIKQTENDKQQITETYSLEPLWKNLYNLNDHEQNREEGTIFILFEQEFGRPLSPFEIETINAWLDKDKFIPSLIKAALREAVLMGKLNFKYIDRILREWKRKGIHTVDQARQASKSFHNHQTSTKKFPEKKRNTSFYYNWLEGDD